MADEDGTSGSIDLSGEDVEVEEEAAPAPVVEEAIAADPPLPPAEAADGLDATPPPDGDVPPPGVDAEDVPPPGTDAEDVPPPGTDAAAEAAPSAPTVVPLGKATSASLLDCDQKPFILDKMYREGKMTRLTTAGSSKKMEDGGSVLYEDYKWQLEKLYRQVPASMSLGNVRMKPDELLYEGEKFILGKMERDIREQDGYVPTAGKRESELDLSEAIEVDNLPPEPKPCREPYFGDEDEDGCGGPKEESCFFKVTSATGKVYEFAYSGLMAVSVDAKDGEVVEQFRAPGQCGQSGSRPATPTKQFATPCQEPELTQNFPPTASSAGVNGNGQKPSGGTGTCKNNLPCESQVQAVCNAARNAMAIYDTLTGCDNFPCNVGDKPELEMQNVQDGVWSWLYTLIYKMVPVDSTDENSNGGVPDNNS